jgi:hypothetical protein
MFYRKWPESYVPKLLTKCIKISSKFVCFINEQFCFCSYQRFQTPLQNFDFGLSTFESSIELANFQNQSYFNTTVHTEAIFLIMCDPFMNEL